MTTLLNRPFVARSFTPDLLALRELTEQTACASVLKIWTANSVGVEVAGQPFPDEAEVIAGLTEDFNSAALNNLFCFGQPKPIADIRSRHSNVMRAPEAHILDISRTQYAEIIKLVSTEPDLEKRKSVLERAELKRRTLVTELIEQMDKLEEEAEQLLVIETCPYLELRKELLKGRRQSASDIEQLAKRKFALLTSTIGEARSILTELYALEAGLAVIRSSKAKLIRLKARIDQAHPTLAKPAVEPIRLERPLQQEAFAPLKTEVVNRVNPRHLEQTKRGAAASDSNPERKDPVQSSLDRVREAVALGNESGVLRLVIPKEGQVRVRGEVAWKQLLDELGFTGDLIVAPSYESLAIGAVPIIMPRKMNTHTHRWKKAVTAPVFIIDFAHPALLLRLHQGQL